MYLCDCVCVWKLVEYSFEWFYLNQNNSTIKMEVQAVLIWTKIPKRKINQSYKGIKKHIGEEAEEGRVPSTNPQPLSPDDLQGIIDAS